jgi:methylmalonyl-CoA/ethylmalonyl-CoA epimerase
MIKGINHIGLVVKNIDETLGLLSGLFGAREIGRKAFPEIGQTSCLVAIGDSKYELMEPLGSEGVVPKFLAKNGEGFHHISLESSDLDADCENLENHGAKIIARAGKIAFTHPRTTGGIVYEIEEIKK